MLEFSRYLNLPSPLEIIHDRLYEEKRLKVYVKRDDLIHPEISGNKFRKLKYNLLKANELGCKTLLTFGGAYSNHIYAVASAGKIFGFKTIGIIRGDELNENSSSTLKFCSDCSMELHFVSRTDFRTIKEILEIDEINRLFQTNFSSETYIIPEGGTNALAIKGGFELVDEIIEQLGEKPNYICTAVGSGGTLAGIVANHHDEILTIGVAVLKDADYVFSNMQKMLVENQYLSTHWRKFLEFHHGGYAKTTPELIEFIKNFERKHHILLDQVYTGKMFFAIHQLIEQNEFEEDSTLVLVHTGGLQGRNLTEVGTH